ncbi:MAG: hypothetical protein COB51_11455 [Moraxellaceae bacterium]|nr:MAG: hypothetical protein COB51_11455 [Moraxellaceae bacterium]
MKSIQHQSITSNLSGDRIARNLNSALVSVLALISVLVWSLPVLGEELVYRYVDENGYTVMDDRIPEQYIKNGYTVINSFGAVIRVVEAALTEDQLGRLEKSAREKIEGERLKAITDAADRQLLKTFADPSDAERAMNRQLEALDIRVDITRGSIKRLVIEKENENEHAAALERSGRGVTEEILSSLNRIERQIGNAYVLIDEKEQEKVQLRKAFAVDIKRLRELRGMPAMSENDRGKGGGG